MICYRSHHLFLSLGFIPTKQREVLDLLRIAELHFDVKTTNLVLQLKKIKIKKNELNTEKDLFSCTSILGQELLQQVINQLFLHLAFPNIMPLSQLYLDMFILQA